MLWVVGRGLLYFQYLVRAEGAVNLTWPLCHPLVATAEPFCPLLCSCWTLLCSRVGQKNGLYLLADRSWSAGDGGGEPWEVKPLLRLPRLMEEVSGPCVVSQDVDTRELKALDPPCRLSVYAEGKMICVPVCVSLVLVAINSKVPGETPFCQMINPD